jgi:HPt (histidine-containing phosphotransfer) domain-containing protein
LEAGNISEASDQIHTLKGAAASISGEALRALTIEMENDAKAGRVESLKSKMPELKVQTLLLQEELRKSFPLES